MAKIRPMNDIGLYVRLLYYNIIDVKLSSTLCMCVDVVYTIYMICVALNCINFKHSA